MSDDRASYLASTSGARPADHERLDLIREILGQDATWAEPPPEVADRLLAAIGGAQRPEPVPAQIVSRRRGLAAALAATFVSLAVVALVVNAVMSPSEDEEHLVPIAGTELEPAATGEAAIHVAGAGWWIELELEDLPAAAEGMYYEGWLWNDDGEGVSIGTFHLREDDEAVVLWSGVDPADYPAIWLTLEDEDGNPAASERVVMRGSPPAGG
ncbi:MAG TPA: anti-sigma factor [Acidimicrobiia bacterium]|nr:anti-sigma factor [Acidimicrobiia bacterium]